MKVVYENDYFKICVKNNILSIKALKGGAAILPLTRNKEVIMMRIFRENVGEESWEIPRGFTENEENGFMTAQREMMEEISCESEKIINLGYIFTDTGLMDSKINLYLGINTEIKEDRLQKEEGINTIKFIDYDSVYNMALKGEINDSYTLAAILRSKPYV